MQFIDPISGGTIRPSLVNAISPLGKVIAAWHVSHARKAARRLQWDVAVSRYLSALRCSLLTGKVWVQLGNALGQTGRLAAAEIAYENATRAEPRLALGYKHLGIVLHGTHRHEEGMRALAMALLHAPDDASVRELLNRDGGDRLCEAHLTDAAFDSVDSRLKAGFIGFRATAWRKRARRAARLGDWRTAEQLYRRIIDIRRDDAHSMIQLGHALNEQQRLGEAEGAYRRAVAADPYMSEAWLHLGYILTAQGKHVQAGEAFSVVARLAPSKRKSHPLVMAQEGVSIFSSARGISEKRKEMSLPMGLSLRSQALWLALANRHGGSSN